MCCLPWSFSRSQDCSEGHFIVVYCDPVGGISPSSHPLLSPSLHWDRACPGGYIYIYHITLAPKIICISNLKQGSDTFLSGMDDKSPVALIQENHNGLTTVQLWWLGDEEPGISCFHSLHPHHSLSILHCCSQFFCHPKICKILENDDETYYTNFLVLVNSSKKTSFLTWFRKQKTLLKTLGLEVPCLYPPGCRKLWAPGEYFTFDELLQF